MLIPPLWHGPLSHAVLVNVATGLKMSQFGTQAAAKSKSFDRRRQPWTAWAGRPCHETVALASRQCRTSRPHGSRTRRALNEAGGPFHFTPSHYDMGGLPRRCASTAWTPMPRLFQDAKSCALSRFVPTSPHANAHFRCIRMRGDANCRKVSQIAGKNRESAKKARILRRLDAICPKLSRT